MCAGMLYRWRDAKHAAARAVLSEAEERLQTGRAKSRVAILLARQRAKERYAETRAARARAMYLRVLPRIKSPRRETLLRYGLYESADGEGWEDDAGAFIPRGEKTLA